MEATMTCQELIDYCLTFPNAYEDYPFEAMANPAVWALMRHAANKKSFAMIYEKEGKLCINLKCDPFEADFLRQTFKDVNFGYHMNKLHWNTVALGGDVPMEELRRQIQNSYDLIKPSKEGNGL